MERRMSVQMDSLAAQVKANSSVVDSAIVLIRGLAQRIQDLINAGANPAALQAFVDELKSKDDALAAEVVANTPAAPPAAPVV